MKFYFDNDADLSIIKEKKIGIIGFGNQAKAHALNLNDSGLHVTVGLRKNSPNFKIAQKHGLQAGNIEDVSRESDLIILLIPDEHQQQVYETAIKPYLKEGNIVGFAHGFNLQFGYIKPPEFVDVIINSPKCIGYLVRENFTKGYGFPNLIAVHQDFSGKAKEFALAYAKGIGGTRAGVMDSTVEEETVTNLFGEQSVLCGGIVELIKAAFDTLVDAGYSPEVAFMECMQEIKPIIELFYTEGLAEMNKRISNTAEYGEYLSGPRVINSSTREGMKAVLKDIQSGDFARKWMEDNKNGNREFLHLRKQSAEHEIEKVGKMMREMMPWLRHADSME